MGKAKQKTYSKEFKAGAVRMITKDGHKAAEVARDLGIPANMLYLWKRRYLEDQQEAFPGHGRLKSTDDYIRKIELENNRLKDKRDILKKARNRRLLSNDKYAVG